MAEVSDHSVSFTISLSPPPVTCAGATPHHSSGCALLNAFDVDRDGIISMDEMFAASDAGATGLLTEEEVSFVNDAYVAGSINALCASCYIPPTPAKGEIRNISYPATAIQGTNISIECRVYNSGESAGTFKVALYLGTTQVTETSTWQQSANTTTGIKMLSVIVPSTGVSVSYTLKCIRIT